MQSACADILGALVDAAGDFSDLFDSDFEKASVLTAEYLRYLIHYDPWTGVFRWRNSRARKIGPYCRVFVRYDRYGYRVIRFGGRRYRAARLAFFYMTGRWPSPTVDHINRVRDDDRWLNLREASWVDQARNRGRTISRDLPVGVYKVGSRYRAMIGRGGVLVYLGRFSTIAEASLAYQAAAAERDCQYSCLH